MNRSDFPFPEEVFPEIYYTHNDGRFGVGKNIRGIGYDEMLRDAGKYIGKFQTGKLGFDIDRYNFSVFQTNDRRAPSTMIGGYIRFLSNAANDVLGIDSSNQVSDSLLAEGKTGGKEIGKLWTEIFSDTEYMLSLNYEDFPIAFLGFEIDRYSGEIKIKQIQSSKVVDKTRTFLSEKHHLLNNFEWTKVLVDFFEQYLIEKGYQGKVVFQSSENNSYYTLPENMPDDDEAKKRKKRVNTSIEKKYNPTAEYFGYERDTSAGWNSKFEDYSKIL